ncbi:universal stress protein [Pseudomonas sp. UL073]|uniref:Universal stress protein n=1 Tax=Zestomonas insulae TaxID=2809017 RepID=A0ABS2IBW4_9GAMM|nr:universal stress protein [Pseudomonas insulae]MBM7060609.1 universal stress protein [Pseudomonas insulae]
MNRLLVATDLSARSDLAVQRAALLAKQFDCEWTLLHVIDDDAPQPLIERQLHDARALLEDRVEGLALIAGRRPRVMVECGAVEQTIDEVAAGTGCALLVLGMQRRSLLRDIFRGTTAERIIRRSRLPVLRVASAGEDQYRRVLFACDLSASSVHALQTARTLGLVGDGELHATYVFEAFAKGQMLMSPTEAAVVAHASREAREQAGEEFQRFLREQQLSVPPERTHLEEGFAVVELKRSIVAVDPDLVVIGTHGRTGFRKMMLGSVAESLLGEVGRDMLCVPLPARS